MERQVYERMAELDSRHWWYRARREVLASLIARKVAPPAGARILEVGCGTGHNLAMLGRFGRVDAVEMDDAARAVATRRLGRPVTDARLPELAGVDGGYDLVAALDVVEHVREDEAALAALASRLAPGGRLLLAVPAHPWLWSVHDEISHHQRRYTRRTFRAAIAAAGLKLEWDGWINSLLFPVAVAARLAGRVTGKTDADDKLPPGPVNAVFERIFALEHHAVGRLPLPVGLSLVAVASPAT